MKKLIFTFAIGATLSVCAASYDATTDWDSVSSVGYEDGTGDLTSANRWTNTGGVATVQEGVIKVDTEEQDGELVYTPVAPLAINDQQAVYLHLPSVVAGSDPAAPVAGTQAALAAVDGGYVTNWYGWSATGWTKLVGATPPADGGCDVRFAFSNSVNKVCYAVNTGSGWTVLKPENALSGWMTKGVDDSSVGVVTFSGKASLTGVELTQTGTVTASDTFESRKSAQGIADADLNEIAKNGNRNWENLVLGLNCNDALSKPVVQPVQTSDAATVTLALGGVDVDTDSGATVQYRVRAYDDEGEKATSAYVAATTPTAMALPSSGVRYYQMEVVTTPSK